MAVSKGKREFLEHFKEAADRICPEYGVSPQVCVSQAVLETGWGWARTRKKRKLTLEEMFKERGYNFFGLKGKGDAGSQYWKTKEHRGAPKDGVVVEVITDRFAKFSSTEAGIRGYCRKLTNKRYKGAAENFSDDPGRYITYVWGKGYATAGAYATKVMGVMRSVSAITGDESYDVRPDKGLQEVIDLFRTVPAGKKRRKILAEEMKTLFRKPPEPEEEEPEPELVDELPDEPDESGEAPETEAAEPVDETEETPDEALDEEGTGDGEDPADGDAEVDDAGDGEDPPSGDEPVGDAPADAAEDSEPDAEEEDDDEPLRTIEVAGHKVTIKASWIDKLMALIRQFIEKML
jgi:hypothetical protein